jgi:hypothetical protein
MKVTDVYGRILEVKSTYANSTIKIGASYTPGGYFVQLTQGNQRQQLKLIKTMKK